MNDDQGRGLPGRTESPCRRQCTLDDEDVCVGCGRTLTEICGWSALDEDGRKRVCAVAAARLAARERRVR